MATLTGTIALSPTELATLAKQVAIILGPSIVTPPVVTPPVVVPPVITPPVPAGVVWIYHDGLIWANDLMNYGDWAYDYLDTTGKPPVGTHCLKATGTQGGFQPGAPGLHLDTTGLNFLIFSVKPTQPGNDWKMGAMSSDGGGDTAIPGGLNVMASQFADKPFTPGQWSTCKIPLHAGGFNWPLGQHLRKIMWQEATGAQGVNTYFLCEACLSP